MIRSDPHPGLRTHVSDYCGYVEQSAAPLRRRELPTGEVVLVFSFGDPLRLLDSGDPAAPGTLLTSFVSGPYQSYALTESLGLQHGVQVTLTALGAYMLFGVPTRELTDQSLALEEVFGSGGRLASRLYEAPSWEARFDLLDVAFTARMADARPPSRGVAWAWARLRDTHGAIAVGGLASDLGWSRRHFAARFREQVGLTPKLTGRIFRFRRAIDLLEHPRSMQLADIAYECGYYDQAHLNRDFREFAGGAPTELVARRLPDGGGLAG